MNDDDDDDVLEMVAFHPPPALSTQVLAVKLFGIQRCWTLRTSSPCLADAFGPPQKQGRFRNPSQMSLSGQLFLLVADVDADAVKLCFSPPSDPFTGWMLPTRPHIRHPWFLHRWEHILKGFQGNGVDMFPFLTFAPDRNCDATAGVATQRGRSDPEEKH